MNLVYWSQFWLFFILKLQELLNNFLVNMGVCFLPIGNFPLSHQGIVPVLDHVFSSAPFKYFGDAWPPFSLLLDGPHQEKILFDWPFFLLDALIEVIIPSLSALAIGSEEFAVRFDKELKGYRFPFKMVFLKITFDNFFQCNIFLFSPNQLFVVLKLKKRF